MKKKFQWMLMGAALLLCWGCGQQGQGEQAPVARETKDASSYVVETILSRRSVRKYTTRPVEREKLRKILECGINAPNGMNMQPWEVRVVDDAAYIDGITAEFKKTNSRMAEEPGFVNMFRNAPAVIFIASPKDGSGQIDCGLLGGNMIIAAQSMGLGTCCLGGVIQYMRTDAAAAPYVERLGLSEDYQLLYAIAIGYPDESPEAKPRDDSKVRFVE